MSSGYTQRLLILTKETACFGPGVGTHAANATGATGRLSKTSGVPVSKAGCEAIQGARSTHPAHLPPLDRFLILDTMIAFIERFL